MKTIRPIICRICGHTSDSRGDFITDRKRVTGCADLCRQCSTKRNRAVLDENRRIVNEAKARPCADCGNEYPHYVMDFDHRDRTQKSFGIGRSLLRSTKILLSEIAKCDVVCANCHRIRTYRLPPSADRAALRSETPMGFARAFFQANP